MLTLYSQFKDSTIIGHVAIKTSWAGLRTLAQICYSPTKGERMETVTELRTEKSSVDSASGLGLLLDAEAFYLSSLSVWFHFCPFVLD